MGRAAPALAMLALLLCSASAHLAHAAESLLGDLPGRYEGQTVEPPDDGLAKRDLGVTIREHGKTGFTVEWMTVIREPDEKPRQRAYSVDFEATDRPGIFGSAMRKDMFARAVPLDPLKGEPYFWARILGSTLTVHALLILDDGSYEIQTHDRTVTADGMKLVFTRVREGRLLRTIVGELRRVRE
jgi:hypothetical protein